MDLKQAIKIAAKKHRYPASLISLRGKQTPQTAAIIADARAMVETATKVDENEAMTATAAPPTATPHKHVEKTPKTERTPDPAPRAEAAGEDIQLRLTEQEALRMLLWRLCTERGLDTERYLGRGSGARAEDRPVREEARGRYVPDMTFPLAEVRRANVLPQPILLSHVARVVCAERGLDPEKVLGQGSARDPLAMEIRAEARRRIGVADAPEGGETRPVPEAPVHVSGEQPEGMPFRVGRGKLIYLACSCGTGRMFPWISMRTFQTKATGEPAPKTFRARAAHFECDTCDRWFVDLYSVRDRKRGTFVAVEAEEVQAAAA
jgi:hypothetical protein